MMHILIISSAPYQFSESPLLGVFQKDQLEALTAQGLNVGILSPAGRSLRYLKAYFSNQPLSRPPKQCLRNTWFDIFPRTRRIQRVMFNWMGLRQYREYVKQFGKPDLIHAHNALNAGCLARLIESKYQQPYVITEHSSWIARDIYDAKTKKLISHVYQEAKSVICVSQYLKKRLHDVYIDKDVTVIPNIVDPIFTQKYELSSGSPKNTVQLITVASLDDNKNQQLLIRAVAALLKQHIQVHLTIVGQGPNEFVLKALVDELSLAEFVTFTGSVSRDNVRKLMLESDILCISSYVETFGVVAIEANALGLPVITTPCGGPEDIITQVNSGLLLPDMSLDTYVSGLRRLISELSEHDRVALTKYALSQYSASSVATSLHKIYANIDTL